MHVEESRHNGYRIDLLNRGWEWQGHIYPAEAGVPWLPPTLICVIGRSREDVLRKAKTRIHTLLGVHP